MTDSNPPQAQQPPTEADAVAAFRQVFGDAAAEAIWSTAVRTAGLTAPPEDVHDLMRVCVQLTEISEAMRVASRSLRIRLIAHGAMMRSVAP
jgi:hypothetical protein